MADSVQLVTTAVTAILAASISAVVGVSVAAFNHIKGREKERRERRLKILEETAIEMWRRLNAWSAAIAAATSYIVSPSPTTLTLMTGTYDELDKTTGLWDLATKLDFFGFEGCAKALAHAASLEGSMYVTRDNATSLPPEELTNRMRTYIDAVNHAEAKLKQLRDLTESAGWRSSLREFWK